VTGTDLSRSEIPSLLSIGKKAALAREVLRAQEETSLSVTILSGRRLPWAPARQVAQGVLGMDGVNGRVGLWLLEGLGEWRVRGWAAMDYCDVEVVRVLAECNFKSRLLGEEGW
jgi:hypothetical protein